jgi:hypothetical protein
MPRYADDLRNRALLVHAAHLAADKALHGWQTANEAKDQEIDLQFAPRFEELRKRQDEACEALSVKHEAERKALHAEADAAKGIADLTAAADAAEQAWIDMGEECPDFLRVYDEENEEFGDNIVHCATSGKPIFADEDTVEDEMGKIHLEAEVERKKAEATAAA